MFRIHFGPLGADLDTFEVVQKILNRSEVDVVGEREGVWGPLHMSHYPNRLLLILTDGQMDILNIWTYRPTKQLLAVFQGCVPSIKVKKKK